MTGKEYADLIARYLVHRFDDRGVDIYREVSVGRSIIGKNRRIDIILLHRPSNRSMAIECKYQDSSGTVDEKIPYALDDLRAMSLHGVIAYAGRGFSSGVLHLLQSSELAAHCIPSSSNLDDLRDTWELDHAVACHFSWWDILLKDKEPFRGDSVDGTDPWNQAGSLFANISRKG